MCQHSSPLRLWLWSQMTMFRDCWDTLRLLRESLKPLTNIDNCFKNNCVKAPLQMLYLITEWLFEAVAYNGQCLIVTCVCVCVCVCARVCTRALSHVRLFVTLWTIAHQAPLSMGFPRQEYWSRLPFPSPGDLPDPGIKPVSPVSATLAGRFFTTAPGKPQPLLNLPGMNVKLASYSTPAPQGCQNYLPKEQIWVTRLPAVFQIQSRFHRSKSV